MDVRFWQTEVGPYTVTTVQKGTGFTTTWTLDASEAFSYSYEQAHEVHYVFVKKLEERSMNYISSVHDEMISYSLAELYTIWGSFSPTPIAMQKPQKQQVQKPKQEDKAGSDLSLLEVTISTIF